MAEQTPAGIKEDTVSTLLDEVREQLKAEDAREQSLNTRAGGLAGFVAVIVALTSGLGKLALDADLSSRGALLVGIAFGLTLAALSTALGFAVLRVLIPQEAAAISIQRIEQYPTWAYITKDDVMVRGEIMRGWISALAKDRQRNSSKAKWLRVAYIALLIATLGLVLIGAILAIDAAG